MQWQKATKGQNKMRHKHWKQKQCNGVGVEHMELIFMRQLFVVGMIFVKEQDSP